MDNISSKDFDQSLEGLTFEVALKKLEAVTQQLEQSQLSLEDSIELYSQGMKLSRFCNDCIDKARQKIAMLMPTEVGEQEMQAFQSEYNQ